MHIGHIGLRSWRARRSTPASARPTRAGRLLELAGVGASLVLLLHWMASAAHDERDLDRETATRAATGTSPRLTALDGRELLIAGYGGAPYTYPSDVKVERRGVHDFTAKDVPWDGRPFKNPIYYGVRIVHWPEGGRLGSMLDFTHSKTIARLGEDVRFRGILNAERAPDSARIGDVFKRLEASHGHNMLTVNGLLRFPVLGLRLRPYAGLGAGVALPHAEVQLTGDNSRTYEYQYAGPVAQGLVGLEVRLPHASVFVEYKFTFADYRMPLTGEDGSWLPFDLWRQAKRWWQDDEPLGGNVETELISHQAIFGAGYRIAPAP